MGANTRLASSICGSSSSFAAVLVLQLKDPPKFTNSWIGSEARGGIEPPIKVLQTFALPLGDRATETTAFYHFQ